MKHYTRFIRALLLLILVNLSLSISAQNLKLNKDRLQDRPAHHENIDAFDLPQKSIEYLWDETSKTYIEEERGIIKFNNRGDIISYTFYIHPSDSLNRTLYVYDALNHFTEAIYQNWSPTKGQWVNSAKDNFIRDKNDVTIEYTNSIWESNTWKLAYGFKREHITDLQGRNIKITNSIFINNGWENEWKEEFTYLNNTDKGYNTLTKWLWKNNSWFLDYRLIDIEWKDASASEISKSKTEEYIDNIWKSTKRLTSTFTNNTDYVKLYESNKAGNWVFDYRENISDDVKIKTRTEIKQKYINGQWVNESRYKEFYDDGRGNNQGYAHYNWINNDWVLTYSYTASFDTENRFVEEKTEALLDSGIRIEKTTFSDFAQIMATNNTPSKLETAIQVFPNPSKEYIEVKTSSNEPSPFSVMNSLGMEIQTGVSGQPMDVKNWIPGVYYIKINNLSGGSSTAKKFIKE